MLSPDDNGYDTTIQFTMLVVARNNLYDHKAYRGLEMLNIHRVEVIEILHAAIPLLSYKKILFRSSLLVRATKYVEESVSRTTVSKGRVSNFVRREKLVLRRAYT